MIVRIKEISQVGGFKQFKTGGSVPFDGGKSVTLVHAMNTLGKTTFVQILKSLGYNDPSLILKRKTIPPDVGVAQKVILSYKDLLGTEKTVRYSSGTWGDSDLEEKILVFDQEFIHSHVMTGDLITRDNKETFTDFILGSAGVKLSQKIEKDKKTYRNDKARLSDFRPDFVQGALSDKDVDTFVDMTITDDTPTLEKLRETDEKRLRRIERVGEFKALTEPVLTDSSAEKDVTALKQDLTLVLDDNYNKVSDEAWNILQDHISSNCNGEVSIAWLKSGLKVKKTDACPFCGQNLNDAKVLIDAYQTIFDQQFEQYDAVLKGRMRKLTADISFAIAQSYVSAVNDFIKKADEFNPFIPELEAALKKMDEQVKLLEALDEEFKVTLAQWGQDAEVELDSKKQSTHKSMKSSIDTTTLIDQAKKVATKQSDIKQLQEQIKEHIINAKKKVDELKPEQLEAEKRNLNSQIAEANKKIARIAQDRACATYKTKRNDLVVLKNQTDKDIEQLEGEQSVFLDQYFDRLGYWFKQLGSNPGFEITKSTNKKGDKKVYTLALDFYGEKILPEDLSKVFSESDKRNLALAIFLSKADNLVAKNEYVLVFDDPVVSFDDNRRRKTCRVIKKLAGDFRQIIVTTHYSSLVKHFVEENLPATYVEIKLEGNQSCFKVLKPELFVLSPHQRECEKIIEFVEGGSALSNKDLRPFMEEHLRQRFQAQLIAAGVNRMGLEDLIDKLSEFNLIGDDTKANLHGFRQSYNPEHHRSGDPENIEEQRNDARELMDLLYSQMSD